MFDVRRREFITLLGGAAAAPSFLWPLAARAQRGATPVVGFLGAASFAQVADRLRALRQGLKEAGYVVGENVALDYQVAEGEYERLPALALAMVRRQVSVIVCGANAGGVRGQSRERDHPHPPLTKLMPVALPPGRGRLATSPSCTGSSARMKTVERRDGPELVTTQRAWSVMTIESFLSPLRLAGSLEVINITNRNAQIAVTFMVQSNWYFWLWLSKKCSLCGD